MGWGHRSAAPHDHAVKFYDGDQDGVAVVAAYVAEGLSVGEAVVVVVTDAHRVALEVTLRELGWDPHTARATGRFVVLDAVETLGSFMVDRSPDADAFAATVGDIIDEARGSAATVRVFGEMVAVLWEQGHVAAALELESLWNDLAVDREFTLLCAYPHALLAETTLVEVARVCDLHSDVRAPGSYDQQRSSAEDLAGDQRSEVFLPVPNAVASVRRFVTGVLERWGEEGLVADAVLASSEMATNAIRHADSPFHAIIDRSDGVLRIAIEDAGAGQVSRRAPAVDDLSGRGMVIVEALADRWGCDMRTGGKVVWAEFATTALSRAG